MSCTARALTMLLPLLVVTPAIAKKTRPQACPAGRFLVTAAATPLLPGRSPTPEALAYDDAHAVTLDACGAASAGTVKATRKATVVRGRWNACGSFAKVAATARIATPACDTLAGRVKARKVKAKAFTATRSTCGDGVVDGAGGEACDASAPNGDASCPGACTACTCATTTSSTTTTTIPGACPSAPGYSGGPSLAVTSASATIVDPLSAPLAGVPAQIFGLNLASAVQLSDAGGGVVVNGPPGTLSRPMLRYGDARTFAKLLVPLTSATSSLGTLTTAALPSTGADLVAGTPAVSGTVALTPPAGASVLIDTLDYPTADDQQFRAVALSVAQQSAVVGPSGLDLALLFGTAPTGTLFCPSADVVVPNTPGWAANAAVEFWVQGDDVGQAWAPFGGWAKLSDGHVSGDGATVATDAGQGFPILTALFGVRRTPP